MIGSLRWNFVIALSGMILTMMFALMNNLFFTALVRGAYCFILLFIFSFFIRFCLGLILGVQVAGKQEAASSPEEMEGESYKGEHIDFSTPDTEIEFAPLDPPKLSKVKEKEPEELIEAIRHLAEK